MRQFIENNQQPKNYDSRKIRRAGERISYAAVVVFDIR